MNDQKLSEHLAKLGALGGSVSSAAKTAAARKNAKKKRPRKKK
jgi:hypothetical protein